MAEWLLEHSTAKQKVAGSNPTRALGPVAGKLPLFTQQPTTTSRPT